MGRDTLFLHIDATFLTTRKNAESINPVCISQRAEKSTSIIEITPNEREYFSTIEQDK